MKKNVKLRHKYIGKAYCPFTVIGAKVLVPKGTPYKIWHSGFIIQKFTKKNYWVKVSFYDLGDDGDMFWRFNPRNPHIGWNNRYKLLSTVDVNYIKDYILPF